MSRFPVKIVLSQSTERIRGRTLQCFRKSLLSKNVRDKRGVCSDFPSNLFCLTVPNNFVRESLCNSGKLRYGEILWTRRGEEGSFTIFRRNLFVSRYPNVSQRNPSVFQKSAYRKFLGKRGGFYFFWSETVCLTVPMNF